MVTSDIRAKRESKERERRYKKQVTRKKEAKVAKETPVRKAVIEATHEPREARAIGRRLRISPTKVRGVLDLVRGQTVGEARRILRFSPKKGARFALKLLDSAVANAGVGGGFDEASWVVSEIRADKGPTFRRRRDPKAKASWGMIVTPSTHLKIVIRGQSVVGSRGKRNEQVVSRKLTKKEVKGGT